MIKNNKLIMFFLLLTIIVFLTSCNGDSIEDHLQYLSSKECMGRYPGTQGNENAAKYIREKFVQYGLLPWKDTYLYPSEITLLNTENLVDISLTSEDGKKITFENGKDYIQIFPQNCNLSLPLTDEPDGEDCILLLKNRDDMEQYVNSSYVKAFLLYDDTLFRKNSDIKRNDNLIGKPFFEISDDMYKQINKDYKKIININSSYVEDNVVVNNVLGKIEGEITDTVLVISAHFDHVGFVGDNIWYGAIDNASGVSSLLELARWIDKDSKPECDILFCAFNCEEEYFIGSRDIYELIKNDYKYIYNLNIDCVGGKEINTATIDRNKGSDLLTASLCEELNAYLDDSGIESKLATDTVPSDHISFPNGICISTDYDIKSIHTANDKKELIDIAYLNKITESLQYSIPALLKTITNNEAASEEKAEIDISSIADKLNIGEYCFVNIDNDIQAVSKRSTSQSMEDFEKEFMLDLSFASTIFNEENSLLNITLGQNFYATIANNNEKIIDKVYKKELDINDLFSIRFRKKEILYDPIIGMDFLIFNIENEIDAINYDETEKINKSDIILDLNKLSLSLVDNQAIDPEAEEQNIIITTELSSENTHIIVNILLTKEFDLADLGELFKENKIEDIIIGMGDEIFTSVSKAK